MELSRFYICASFGLLVVVECALHLKVPFRNGPEMCESLSKRGCDVTFHRENLSCAFHGINGSSAEKTHAAQQEALGKSIPGQTTVLPPEEDKDETKRGKVWLFTCGRHNGSKAIVQTNIVTGKKERKLPVFVKGWRKCLTCSATDMTVYLVSCHGSKLSVSTITIFQRKHEIKTVTTKSRKNQKRFRFLFDSENQLLFGFAMHTVWQYSVSTQRNSFSRLGVNTSDEITSACLAFEIRQILLCTKKEILSVDYGQKGSTKTLLYSGNGMRGIAYDFKSKLVYFNEKQALKKLSVSGGQAKDVIYLAKETSHLDVRSNILLYVPLNDNKLIAMDLRAKRVLRSFRVGKRNGLDLFFCRIRQINL